MALRAAAVAALLILAAGCTSAPPPPEPKVVESSEPAPARATLLRVLVINDEFLPIWGASVRVVGLGLNATTDEVGNAYFQVAKAGRYSVHVHHGRYYPNVSRIEVATHPDQVHRVTLRDAPPHGHFREYRFSPGACFPVVFAANLTGNGACPETPTGRHYARFILQRGLVEAYIELAWDQQPVGPQAMRMEARWPGLTFSDGSSVALAQGGNPVKLRLPPERFTADHAENGLTAEVHVGLSWAQPAAVNLYQPYEVLGIFDYFIPAPDVDPEA